MSLHRSRFGSDTDDLMLRYCSSLAVDLQMLDQDIRGSMAHVRMLGEVAILTDAEVSALSGGLARVREEINEGTFRPGDEHEDIHMAIEARLTELLGELGGKLHTARSCNDQVATDVRLWLKAAIEQLDMAISEVIQALLDRVTREGKTLIPGYTHLQRGQPILLGHHLLAHAWALSRDRARLADAAGRIDSCPLGACAMAGTAFPIDRHRTAELLEFAAPIDNAMDAVAARDHEQEMASVCAISMTHLSRMAEELVIWSSSEFALVHINDAYCTGSSIMPQKRNPDAAELVRGKTARVCGDLVTLLALVKAQPLAYNRDLQEDREALFDAVGVTIDSHRIMAAMWRTLEIDTDRFENDLRGDFSLATELADHLASRGVPFREAHEIVGRIVKWCEQQGSDLSALTTDKATEFHPALADNLEGLLDPRAAAERRTSFGGTAWSEIERQAKTLRASLGDPPTDMPRSGA